MQKVVPTPIKFEPEFKQAIQDFANKKEFGNLSAVVKKAVSKYIKYQPPEKKSA